MLVVLTIGALKLALVLKISIKIFFVNNWLDFALYNEILANELEFKFQLKESSWHTMNNNTKHSNNRLTANTTTITTHTTTIIMAANTTIITRNNTLNNKQSNKLNNSNNNKHNNKTNNIDWGVCGGGLRVTPGF